MPDELTPVCNCQGRGLALIFHMKNCPVRVALEGQPNMREETHMQHTAKARSTGLTVKE